MGRKNKKGGRGGRGGRGGKHNSQPSKPEYDENAPLPEFTWERCSAPFTIPEDQQEKINLWTERLTETVGEEFKQHIEHQFQSTAEQLPSLNSEQIAKLLDFYTKHPNVATTAESWDPKITGGKFSGLGFKVCSASGKRLWGGDDGIYRANPNLQEYLPRGCVIVKETEGSPHLAIFGNRKFYGKSSGDDDGSDLTSEAIKRGSFSKFLISEKANGESCHITPCPVGENIWIIGSKNRKIAVSSFAEIAPYKREMFYSMACEMAEVFFQKLDEIGPEKAKELRELLLFTRWTLNFEFEYPTHQHIVPLRVAQLVLIGCSGIHVPCGKASHPILGCALARYFQFPTVLNNLTIYGKEDLDQVCQNIAKEWITEGSVLILLDDDNNVVDFVKVKSWWYILLRCIREKIRRLAGPETVEPTCLATITRIRTLTRSMNISQEYSNCFIRFGTMFVEWLAAVKGNTQPRLENVIDRYPTLWEEFLKDKNLPGDNTLISVAQQSDTSVNLDDKYARSNLPLLILLQGIPGIGKSYLGKKLAERLCAEGIKTKDVAQDDFVAEHGLKQSGKACSAYIRGALARREFRCIILARNNSNPQQYRSYLDLDAEGLCRAIFICPKELKTERLEEAVFVSVAGVLHRQSAPNEEHPTDSMTNNSLASLPLKFFGSLLVNHSAFLVPVLKEEKVTIPDQQKFQSILKYYRSKGFRANDISQDDLTALGLSDSNKQAKYLEFRRDIGEITQECTKFIQHIINKDTPLPGSYLAAALHSESSNRVVAFAQDFFPEKKIPKDWNISCDHVTMMHANSYFDSPAMVAQWEKIFRNLGSLVQVLPVSLLVNQRCIAMKVTLQTTNGDNLNRQVVSKLPHITIACAPGVKSFEIANEIEKAENLIDISEEFKEPLSAAINLIE